MKNAIANPELECLKLKKQINDNHRLAQAAMADAVDRAVLTGELLLQWKEQLPHGQFEGFVELHFDGSLRTARSYMQASKQLRLLPKSAASAVLKSERSIAGLISVTKPPTQGKPGGPPRSSETTPTADGPASSAVSEPRPAAGSEDGDGPSQLCQASPPRGDTSEPAATETPVGKCPVCAGEKWEVQDDGNWNCSKCGHPYGEPAGDPDDDQVKTLISKTRKTLEAALRCFDDLHHIQPSPKHHESITWVKGAMKLLGEW